MKLKNVTLNGFETLKLHDDTLGVTQPALRALRNEIVCHATDELVLCKVPASDGEHCGGYGFVILNRTKKEIVIVGDGFRGDNAGEGGAGHRAALALLTLFGLHPVEMYKSLEFSEDIDHYEQYVQDVLLPADSGQHWEVPLWGEPQYVDWCFAGLR